jgi:hypothetical protein
MDTNLMTDYPDIKLKMSFEMTSKVSSTNNTDCHDINWKIVESGIKHHNPTLPEYLYTIFHSIHWAQT